MQLQLRRHLQTQRNKKMLNIKVVSWSLGIFTATSFVLCVIYGLIAPPSSLNQ